MLRFAGKQRRQISGYPELRTYHSRREQTGQRRREAGGVFPARIRSIPAARTFLSG
jgi:hypothetical protein